MITKFDTRGNLKSDRTIVEIDILEFGEHFVQSFGKDSTRTEIFNNFLSFIESIKNRVLKNLKFG